MPYRKSYICINVVDAHVSRFHPPSTSSFIVEPLVGRGEMAEEREVVARRALAHW
jgi:hypothetical protein